MKCSIKECDREAVSKKMCRFHYNRDYYATHPEYRAYLKDWSRSEKGIKYRKAYYKKNKIRADAVNSIYRAEHIEVINEQQRKARYRRLGKKTPSKQYTFYRDFIMPIHKLNDLQKQKCWNTLLALNLTDKQEEAILLEMAGIYQIKAAKKLKISQSSLAKRWNGMQFDGGWYGGIFAKLRKYFKKHPGLVEEFLALGLKFEDR